MTSAPPSLFGSSASLPSDVAARPGPGATLVDLLYEGLYMVFLLGNGKTPRSSSDFSARVTQFLGEFEREAKRRNFEPEEVYDAKYAFSAMVDEAVLSSRMGIRDEWERQPLQLTLFGDQLAGEHVFDKLEIARNSGSQRLATLEVFHMCLLLGFKGKYLIEGSEKVNYLTAQLGAQIAHIKGRHAGFAPHWKAPDSIVHTLRRELPAWVLAAILTLAGLLGYLGLKAHADALTAQDMAPYTELITYSRKPPHLTITLP